VRNCGGAIPGASDEDSSLVRELRGWSHLSRQPLRRAEPFWRTCPEARRGRACPGQQRLAVV